MADDVVTLTQHERLGEATQVILSIGDVIVAATTLSMRERCDVLALDWLADDLALYRDALAIGAATALPPFVQACVRLFGEHVRGPIETASVTRVAG